MKAPEVKAPKLKAGDFDRAFDAGEDVSGHVDWAQARRAGLEARRVNVDFPAWVVEALDREAPLDPDCAFGLQSILQRPRTRSVGSRAPYKSRQAKGRGLTLSV